MSPQVNFSLATTSTVEPGEGIPTTSAAIGHPSAIRRTTPATATACNDNNCTKSRQNSKVSDTVGTKALQDTPSQLTAEFRSETPTFSLPPLTPSRRIKAEVTPLSLPPPSNIPLTGVPTTTCHLPCLRGSHMGDPMSFSAQGPQGTTVPISSLQQMLLTKMPPLFSLLNARTNPTVNPSSIPEQGGPLLEALKRFRDTVTRAQVTPSAARSRRPATPLLYQVLPCYQNSSVGAFSLLTSKSVLSSKLQQGVGFSTLEQAPHDGDEMRGFSGPRATSSRPQLEEGLSCAQQNAVQLAAPHALQSQSHYKLSRVRSDGTSRLAVHTPLPLRDALPHGVNQQQADCGNIAGHTIRPLQGELLRAETQFSAMADDETEACSGKYRRFRVLARLHGALLRVCNSLCSCPVFVAYGMARRTEGNSLLPPLDLLHGAEIPHVEVFSKTGGFWGGGSQNPPPPPSQQGLGGGETTPKIRGLGGGGGK